VKRGRLMAGNQFNPFPADHKIIITLTGDRSSPGLLIDENTYGGNKVLAVTGKLLLYG